MNNDKNMIENGEGIKFFSSCRRILRKFRGQQPAGPAGDGETQTVSAKCLMSLNGHLLRPGGGGGGQSSLLLFHKIHCGAVSIEKDKYMTPAYNLKKTRSSHSDQYRRHQTYSDALKNSFSPELFHIGIVCLLLWPIPSPQRGLGHSLFKQKFSQKFLCFCVFCVVLFGILSKFPNLHSLV